MAKKSKAQLKRLMKRAEARGEVYEAPSESEEPKDDEKVEQNTSTKNELKKSNRADDDTNKQKQHDDDNEQDEGDKKKKEKMISAAEKLQKELSAIENNQELKAKERRSAKRKAEAIAVESCGCASAEELLEFYKANGKSKKRDKNKTKDSEAAKRDHNPYIVFIGQLSYDTTKEQLFAHIQKELKDEHKITHQNIQIRLLTDPKTKKSRGMAFVEIVSDDDNCNPNPELLYSCLKLHHTHLNGRRINVERSAGGGSEARKHKIQQSRAAQVQHMETVVRNMIEEYYQRGEIARSGELDDGVIALCQRHSATVVQAALERYVESNGRDMDNPSAYFSFLIGKLATEGIYTEHQDASAKKQKQQHHAAASRNHHHHHSNSKNIKSSNKRPRTSGRSSGEGGKNDSSTMSFAKQGIDMTAASSTEGGGEGSKADLVRIFPSLSRGRGRGRGYM